MKRNIYILLFVFLRGVIFSDTNLPLEYVQQRINTAIMDEGRGNVIDVCKELDTIIIDINTREFLIQWLENIYSHSTDERKLNAACFLLYFGEDYSEEIFNGFKSFYFLLGGNSRGLERNYLEISYLAGSINTIHAANAKICIVNAISCNSPEWSSYKSIYDLTILYHGLSSKYNLYILANLYDSANAISEAKNIIGFPSITDDVFDKDAEIRDLLGRCGLLLTNIDESVLNEYAHSVSYFIREIYPHFLAVINYLDSSYLSHETVKEFERMWLLANKF